MKIIKISKIIIFNLLLFLLLFHVADYLVSLRFEQCNWWYEAYPENKLVTYLKHYGKMHNYSIRTNQHVDGFEDLTSDVYYKKGDTYYQFRQIENEFAQKSILLFGCSFAFGDKLNDRKTFSAKLGELLSDYKICNRAQRGWTTSHMLYQLENKDFSKTDISNVKYVIYVFITDHIIRNHNSYLARYTPYYKLDKNNKLCFKKYSLNYVVLPVLYPFKEVLKNSLYSRLYSGKKCKEIELTKRIIEQSNAEVSQKFPDAQFIILRYDKGQEEPYNYMFEELKKEGIVVVTLDDLSNKNYLDIPYQCSMTDIHPNAKAWAEITPLFVKYLQDKGYLKD